MRVGYWAIFYADLHMSTRLAFPNSNTTNGSVGYEDMLIKNTVNFGILTKYIYCNNKAICILANVIYNLIMQCPLYSGNVTGMGNLRIYKQASNLHTLIFIMYDMLCILIFIVWNYYTALYLQFEVELEKATRHNQAVYTRYGYDTYRSRFYLNSAFYTLLQWGLH